MVSDDEYDDAYSDDGKFTEENDTIFGGMPDITEWKYAMRRTMQEIIPRLFLGPYQAACKSKLDDLKARGITHVVCVRHTMEANMIRPNFPQHFKYLVVEIADTMTENIIQHFTRVRDFINDALDSEEGRVLVHGMAGISRSAALVIAYVMERCGMTLRDSYDVVQRRRFCVNPNENFLNQLQEYEPIYRAHQALLSHDQTSTRSERLKRTCDQIEENMDMEAHKVVHTRRCCASPNHNFMNQLREYEPILVARHLSMLNRAAKEGQAQKRSFDTLDDNMG